MRTTLLLIFLPLLAYPQDKANLYVVHQIKQEALENSKVMDHLFWLTDVNGHRLTITGRDEDGGRRTIQFRPWPGIIAGRAVRLGTGNQDLRLA